MARKRDIRHRISHGVARGVSASGPDCRESARTSRRYQSGEVDHGGRISKCGDQLTRRLLFEAASVIMYQSWVSLGIR
ncbi:MAG: transposase [Rhodobacteraceae bacterium]|nr:transposase [Paracoccaceae bacterium]